MVCHKKNGWREERERERERERESTACSCVLTLAHVFCVQTEQHWSVQGMQRDTLLWLLRPNHDPANVQLYHIHENIIYKTIQMQQLRDKH